MALRHAVLPVGAVLVLGLGVYLFVEVRAQPAPPPLRQGRASLRETAPEVPQPAAPAPAEVAGSPPTEARAAPPAGVPSSAPPREVATGSVPDELPPAGPDLDAVMGEANNAYDRGDFESAKLVAGRVLTKHPANVRMLRIMVSASCIDGDSVVAFASFSRLPPADQEQMRVRCARYGITFPDGS